MTGLCVAKASGVLLGSRIVCRACYVASCCLRSVRTWRTRAVLVHFFTLRVSCSMCGHDPVLLRAVLYLYSIFVLPGYTDTFRRRDLRHSLREAIFVSLENVPKFEVLSVKF